MVDRIMQWVSPSLFHPEETDRRTWHKKPLSIFLLYCFIAFLWHWSRSVPSPGYSVAALAVAAAVMAVLGEMRGAEKIAWILVLFGFLFTELKSIDMERMAHEQEQAEARHQQLEQFGKIANGIDSSIQASSKQFDATMHGIRSEIDTATGGDSYAYLEWVPSQDFAIFVHSGKHPLYGVQARIVNIDTKDFWGSVVNIGDMIEQHATTEPVPNVLLRGAEQANVNVFFTARNGDWTELLRVRKIPGGWARVIRVTARFTHHHSEHVVCETIDKNFPLVNGEIEKGIKPSIPKPPPCQ